MKKGRNRMGTKEAVKKTFSYSDPSLLSNGKGRK